MKLRPFSFSQVLPLHVFAARVAQTCAATLAAYCSMPRDDASELGGAAAAADAAARASAAGALADDNFDDDGDDRDDNAATGLRFRG